MPPSAPTLSICIPTHHGRASTLDQALCSVRAQELDRFGDAVEVCVSDNASQDGTEEMIARHAADAPFAISYRRNARDLGGSRNLLQAVAMGSGRWRWLLSSDDALLPDALGHVLWLTERHPDAAGFSFAARWYERDLRTAFDLPSVGVTISGGAPYGRLDGFEAITRRLAQWWSYMSAHLVRDDVWSAGASALPAGLVARTIFPHVAVFALGIRDNPTWAWSSAALVGGRMDNSWYGRVGQVDHAALVGRMARDYDGIWRAVTSRRSRRRMASDWLAANANRAQIHGVRAMGSTRRGRVRLALTLARRMWFVPRLWRETIPALVTGHRATGPPAGPASGALPETEMRTRVEINPPRTWFAGGAGRLTCRLENRGAGDFPVTEPHPVRLGARWIASDSGELAGDSRAELPRPLRAGGSVRLELPVAAPARPGRYELRIAPVQEHVAWFDDLDPENGRAVEALVELPAAGSAVPPMAEPAR